MGLTSGPTTLRQIERVYCLCFAIILEISILIRVHWILVYPIIVIGVLKKYMSLMSFSMEGVISRCPIKRCYRFINIIVYVVVDYYHTLEFRLTSYDILFCQLLIL